LKLSLQRCKADFTLFSEVMFEGRSFHRLAIRGIHVVWLQVWRPVRVGRHDNVQHHRLRHQGDVITVQDVAGNFTLIGQTYFHPSELRFHELTLEQEQRIAFRRGDVLALQFVRYNPVTWSAVPCAEPAQWYLVSRRVTTQPLVPGMTLHFDVEDGVNPHLCRQYSFAAILS